MMGHSADSMGTLGILGGGQLSRMTALAARSFGYRVSALDPDPKCAVSSLSDELVVASFDDVRAIGAFAARFDVVTYDHEHIAPAALEVLADCPNVHPRADALRIVQDRECQKTWLRAQGFPVGPFAAAHDAASVRWAAECMGGHTHIKACRGGFDGRGQRAVSTPLEAERAFEAFGQVPVIVERTLPLAAELSVAVARRRSGELRAFPAAQNVHVGGVLHHALLPASLPAHALAQATTLAEQITVALDVVGLCTVEMFWLADDSLKVNEIALRPHNSYHGSERAFETGQFEQLVRAVFDLPLGPVGVVQPTAMVNLLGDVWLSESPPDLTAALQIPSVRVHLYGKAGVRPGRKLGHLTVTGKDTQEALARALEAHRTLLPRAEHRVEGTDGG